MTKKVTKKWKICSRKLKKTESGYDFSYFEYVEIDSKLPSFETYSDVNIVQSIHQDKQADKEQEDVDNNDDSIQNNIIKLFYSFIIL